MRLKIFILMSIFLCVASGFAHADLKVWLEHSTQKVRPFDEPGTSAIAHLYSAQNEWESVQVLLTEENGDTLTGCNVTVAPFTGPGDDIETVELYRVFFHYIASPSDEPTLPEIVGWWPDALIPFTDSYFGEDRDGAPFDVAAGWNQSIWVDVFIPKGQAPGDYSSQATVTCSGQPAFVAPIDLTVWNFEIPSEISLPSAYGYSCSTVYNFHQAHGGILGRSALTQLYYKEALKNRMMLAWGHCTGPSNWTYDSGSQTGTLDFTAFDAEMGPVLDGTIYNDGAAFDTFSIPRPGYSDPELVAYWKAYSQHFRDKGWFDKLFLYLPDEPTPDEYPILNNLADLLHEADPALKAMATEQIADEMIGHVDIWCPDEPLFSDSLFWGTQPEDYPPRQALGEKVWWYNCTSAQVLLDYSDHFVDSPGMSLRVWTWLTRRYNFDGLLYWSSVYLIAANPDVWEDVYAYPFLCNGDGTMFYPGTVDKIGGTTDIPVPSIRMKLLRDGLEDYEYFKLADDMGYAPFIQNEVEQRAYRTYQWEKDYRLLETSRHKIASLILGELDIYPPDVPENLSVTAGQASLVLTWTAPDNGDLAGFELSVSRYPGERLVQMQLGDQATSALLEELEIGKPYYLSLRAVDEAGNYSPWAAEVSGTPLGQAADDDDDDAVDDDDDDTIDDDDDDDTDDDDDSDLPDDDDASPPIGDSGSHDDNNGCGA